MTATPPPSRRRSRTIRAAALVTLGLGAAGCDDAPHDLPADRAARLQACEAAHRRLGEDPARCEALERVLQTEQAETRPRFRTMVDCQAEFGAGNCEGAPADPTPPAWRPVLAGWSPQPLSPAVLQPVVQDRAGAFWQLLPPAAAAAVAALPDPQRVEAPQRPPAAVTDGAAYARLAPLYADREACEAEWQSCERPAAGLANRFVTRAQCQANWSNCVEVAMAGAPAPAAAAEPGGSPDGAAHGRGAHVWWYGYNSYWRDRYRGTVAPRYQGWTWTADRTPVAAYRPTIGGGLRAWDSGVNRLGVAGRMTARGGFASASVGEPSASRPGGTVSRAGFGSTGRAYSSGG